MRSLVLVLLLLTSAAAQNETSDPAGTDDPEATQTTDEADRAVWWGRAEVQRGVSGVALVALAVAFVAVARK